MVAGPRRRSSPALVLIPFGFTCHSPAVRTALHVLRSSKAPSVALYRVECTLLRGFDSFRAHHLVSMSYRELRLSG